VIIHDQNAGEKSPYQPVEPLVKILPDIVVLDESFVQKKFKDEMAVIAKAD
jgi:hypothetical protein